MRTLRASNHRDVDRGADEAIPDLLTDLEFLRMWRRNFPAAGRHLDIEEYRVTAAILRRLANQDDSYR
ncbi:MAG TPA: hypothetical protein VFP54_10700 [Acidimicrobiales bacterium]|nr:hypothetical protein [Acidimicrobiales bacterium]